jgi:hypothetical protein
VNDRALYVRHDGQVPQDMIEVAARTVEQVTFFPVGGGFERMMAAERFDRLHRPVASDELSHPPVRESTFDIEEMFGNLPGYGEGHRWNGWACPLFPLESCQRIIERVDGARFDPELDAFVIPRENAEPGEEPVDTYRSRIILISGRAVKVWPIGSGSWTWDKSTEEVVEPKAAGMQ